MNGKRSHNFRVFTNALAYFILIIVAILMIVNRFVSKDISLMLGNIIKYLALFLVAMASLWYAVSKRGVIAKVVWLIAVIGIIILMFV